MVIQMFLGLVFHDGGWKFVIMSDGRRLRLLGFAFVEVQRLLVLPNRLVGSEALALLNPSGHLLLHRLLVGALVLGDWAEELLGLVDLLLQAHLLLPHLRIVEDGLVVGVRVRLAQDGLFH